MWTGYAMDIIQLYICNKNLSITISVDLINKIVKLFYNFLYHLSRENNRKKVYNYNCTRYFNVLSNQTCN